MSDDPEWKVLSALFRRVRNGDHAAAEELKPLIYEDLRRLATHLTMHEANGHVLQPTALVNKAYRTLVGEREVEWRNRAHFFAVAVSLMRCILSDYARQSKRLPPP